MDLLRRWGVVILANKWHILFACALFLIIFSNLGNYPDRLDPYVPSTIRCQVGKVFDNEDISDQVTWQWQSMHQHGGGRSPVYSCLIELGLRIFGLTLFGVRFFSALLAFAALLFAYTVLRRVWPLEYLLLFMILLASSPWYLVMTRSGGITGLSLTLVIIALCMTFHLLRGTDSIFPVLAGMAIALVPYGHAITRPVAPFLILFVLFHWKRVRSRRMLLFVGTLLVFLLLQAGDFQTSFRNYFVARGENIVSVSTTVDGDFDFRFFFDKIADNIARHCRFLLGVNRLDRFWNPDLASSYQNADVVFYPRFLVPLFVLGFFMTAYQFITRRSVESFSVLLLFFTGLIPGLASGLGGPNMVRCYLVILPLYYFIAKAIYIFHKKISLETEGLEYPLKRCLNASTFTMALVLFIVLFQLNNFYIDKDELFHERDSSNQDVYSFLDEYSDELADQNILIHGNGNFGDLNYVVLRWLGGESIQKRIESGRLMLLRNENHGELEKLLNDEYYFLALYMDDDMQEIELPYLKGRIPLHYKGISVFPLKEQAHVLTGRIGKQHEEKQNK